MPESQKIIYVDGFAIRNTLDDDFGVLHIAMRGVNDAHPKFYIPVGEVWLDYRYRDEQDFILETDAFTYPTATETYEQRRALAKQKFCTPLVGDEHVIKSEEKDGLTIRYVDGAKVRKCLDPEFILGGHDLVYDYIPEKEIWLDNKMDPAELPYILLHEEVERRLMSEGKPYHIAHEYATVADKELRRQNGVGSYPGDPDYQAPQSYARE